MFFILKLPPTKIVSILKGALMDIESASLWHQRGQTRGHQRESPGTGSDRLPGEASVQAAGSSSSIQRQQHPTRNETTTATIPRHHLADPDHGISSVELFAGIRATIGVIKEYYWVVLRGGVSGAVQEGRC